MEMNERSAAAEEELALEEADAWFEYLEATQAQVGSAGYSEVEPWAWARLSQRLRAVAGARGSSRRPSSRLIP